MAEALAVVALNKCTPTTERLYSDWSLQVVASGVVEVKSDIIIISKNNDEIQVCISISISFQDGKNLCWGYASPGLY